MKRFLMACAAVAAVASFTSGASAEITTATHRTDDTRQATNSLIRTADFGADTAVKTELVRRGRYYGGYYGGYYPRSSYYRSFYGRYPSSNYYRSYYGYPGYRSYGYGYPGYGYGYPSYRSYGYGYPSYGYGGYRYGTGYRGGVSVGGVNVFW